ncbi:MAG: hypothetical protein V3U87_09980 [Methylococcaceae bacterium]
MKLNDQLKLSVFPYLITALYKLGLSYEKLGNISFFVKSNLLVQAKELGKVQIDINNNSQDIYILLMLSGSTFHLYIETLIALALKKKGHNITFLIDDNTLPIHELKKPGNEANWDYNAQRDFLFASKYLETVGLDYISISDFIIDAKKLEYNSRYDSVLEATLLKLYKVGIISDDLPLHNKNKKLIKISIAISEYIGKKLVNIKPHIVIMSHGIYSTWGPVFQVLDRCNIPVLVHGRGKKRHSQVFNWNKTGDSWDVADEWRKVKDNNLTIDQLKEVNEYLASRILHKDDVFVYNFGNETTNDETISYLGLKHEMPIYTLFTNVLWDAASAQREIVFKSAVEWVIETIAWFNDHPDKQLIVKIHPAEVVIGTNMPLYNIILDAITPNINIRIIKPDETINSWSIYNVTTLGMVHTTTAGMELPLVNRPCAVVSKTHYRDKGFTIDVNSKEEYFALLDKFDPSAIDFEHNKREALKYAYLLFIRYQVPFNMFYEEESTIITGFRYESIDEYFLKTNLLDIVNNITDKRSMLNK